MTIAVIILAAAVAVLAFLLIRRPSGDTGDAAAIETMRAEYAAQLEKIRAMNKAEMEMREKFFNEQRARDAESWHRQLEAVNAQAESRFRELSTRIMQQGAKELNRSNSEQIGALLAPLQTRIAEFRKAVDESAVEDKASRKSLRDKLDELARLNASLGAEAEKLSSALRGRSKVQGDWGEMVLRTLLEQGGLTAGIHFTEQLTTRDNGETLRDDQGRGLRPDVIVNMPDGRKLVIDSKVSLTAYIDMCGAEAPQAQREAADRLVKSVKKHVDELATKKYQDYIGSTPDFVVMFIPVEGAYLAALQNDPELWRYAWERRVSISSPTHLFAVMHVVSSLWSQDKRNRNAQVIAEKAGSLYDKLMLFMASFDELGRCLTKAVDSYGTSANRLATGKGNVVKTAQELGEMGVRGKGTRGIPTSLLTAAGQEEDNGA